MATVCGRGYRVQRLRWEVPGRSVEGLCWRALRGGRQHRWRRYSHVCARSSITVHVHPSCWSVFVPFSSLFVSGGANSGPEVSSTWEQPGRRVSDTLPAVGLPGGQQHQWPGNTHAWAGKRRYIHTHTHRRPAGGLGVMMSLQQCVWCTVWLPQTRTWLSRLWNILPSAVWRKTDFTPWWSCSRIREEKSPPLPAPCWEVCPCSHAGENRWKVKSFTADLSAATSGRQSCCFLTTHLQHVELHVIIISSALTLSCECRLWSAVWSCWSTITWTPEYVHVRR